MGFARRLCNTKAKLAIKRLNDKRRFYYEQPKISDKLIHYRIYNKHTFSFLLAFHSLHYTIDRRNICQALSIL